MPKICLLFFKSEPDYTCKRYDYQETCIACGSSYLKILFLFRILLLHFGICL